MRADLGRKETLKRFLFHLHCGGRIVLGGIEVGMAKPVLDNSDIVSARDGVVSASMSEGMRRHIDIGQGRAVALCQEPIFLGKITNPESCKWLTFIVEKKELMLDALLKVVSDGLCGLLPKRNNTQFSAFAHQRNAIGLL